MGTHLHTDAAVHNAASLRVRIAADNGGRIDADSISYLPENGLLS
jgi:hypothetical protein